MRCAAVAVRAYNEAIYRETGIENIACLIEKPTMESFAAICKHEAIRILLVTGGPATVTCTSLRPTVPHPPTALSADPTIRLHGNPVKWTQHGHPIPAPQARDIAEYKKVLADLS